MSIKALTKNESVIVYCPYDEGFDFEAYPPKEIKRIVGEYLGTLDAALIEPYRKGEVTPFVITGLDGYEEFRHAKGEEADRIYGILQCGLVSTPILDPSQRRNGIWDIKTVRTIPPLVAQFLAVAIRNVGSMDDRLKKASTSSLTEGGGIGAPVSDAGMKGLPRKIGN